ncbi:MAG: phage major capsid protein [Bacteroidota bacterium]
MENLTPEQVVEKINTLISEKTMDSVNKTELEALKSELTTLVGKNDNSDLKVAIAKLEGTIEGMKEAKIVGSTTFKSIGETIANTYEKNLDKIKELSSKGGVISLDIKSGPNTMTIDGSYSGGVIALTELEQGVTRIVRRAPFLRQIVNAGVTLSKYITYIEQANIQGGAGMTAEGADKSQSSFDLVERQAVTQKITAFIKVSKEMIADLPFMQREINTELMELVALKLDAQILSGDGTGNNLVGILENATPWAVGSFAGQVAIPNQLDVLRVAMAQIETALFQPNYIVMHPTDVAKFDVTKTVYGEYTQPMIYTDLNGVKRYNGIEIIVNTGIDVDTFLVGDFTKSNLRVREEMNIQVGFVNDDFTKNLFTVLCEARATHYVKTNHYGAFVAGNFTDAIVALID